VIEQILTSRPHPEMGYRSCLGILRLADQYTPARLEAAARRAYMLNACSYRSIKSMLERQLDSLPIPNETAARPSVVHDNIRGADYFAPPKKTTVQ
jgi:hypothetical protein